MLAKGAVSRGLRVLELYCGIGGVAAALAAPPSGAPASDSGGAVTVVAAVDINRDALEVYGLNFGHRRVAALLESLDARRLESFDADLWWASPPCQPFTRRGHGRDLEDPRAATFKALVERIAAVRPRYLALENVAPFETSAARDLLLETLDGANYKTVEERVLCPSELGEPNRRPRYYLLASRDGPLAAASSLDNAAPRRTLRQRLDEAAGGAGTTDAPSLDLLLDPDTARRYRHAIHVVDARDPEAVTSCFTAAYGRSPVRSGSYLATPRGPRRFSPAEVLALLGFPRAFLLGGSQLGGSQLGDSHLGGRKTTGIKKAWRLAGNSLCIPAVRHVLSRVPELNIALRARES